VLCAVYAESNGMRVPVFESFFYREKLFGCITSDNTVFLFFSTNESEIWTRIRDLGVFEAVGKIQTCTENSEVL
jgi:hypothetical protein